MTAKFESRWLATATFVVAISATLPAHAEMSAEELAKLAQNPVGDLISLPFQNNTNFNVGPQRNAQRGGSVCLNSFPGFLSGASAGVRPPRVAAAG